MKTIAAAALSFFAIAAVQAETYDGVHAMTSSATRAQVSPQAEAATLAGNQYGEGATAGVHTFTSTVDRSTVYAEAVARAHDPLASLDRRAFYRDQVPATYGKPKASTTPLAAK